MKRAAQKGNVETERMKQKPEEQRLLTSDNRQPSKSIPEFFKGKCVLVTGATGFLGKVLVEKLLRSCPELEELLILLRPSENGVDKKFEDFKKNPVFAKLQPDALHKLKPLAGDITKDKLDLNEISYEKIISEVSIVFHCAANVKFDAEPRKTLITNLRGVQNISNVCKSFKKLEALVHVSTAYSFCQFAKINEAIYPENADPQKVIEMLEWADDAQIRKLCAYYIEGRPSVYHFSKALAECFIVRSASLPVIIVRPSIITASVNEPFPGWVDNRNGPSGFIELCGKGVVRTLLVRGKVNADWVPVDTVVNTLIAAAHYTALRSKSTESYRKRLNTTFGVPIVNCVCPEGNQITWRKVIRTCLPFLVQYPSKDVCGKPGGTVTACYVEYYLLRLMSHYLPAVLIDGGSCLILKKPQMISLYNRIHRGMGYMEHFTTHPYVFESENMKLLKEGMNAGDEKLFPIDQSNLNWTSYIENYVKGVRRYHLKEKDSTLPEARAKMMQMHYIWLALKWSSLVGGVCLYVHVCRKLGCRLPSSLPSFPYLNSVLNFGQQKFVLN